MRTQEKNEGRRPGRGNSHLVRNVTLGSRAHPQGMGSGDKRPPFGPCRYSVSRLAVQHHRLPQRLASTMLPPLCSLLFLALGLRLAGALNPSDPNTCSFWER